MNKFGTSKIDRVGLTDEQYIAALEVSNETTANEVYRLRQTIVELLGLCNHEKALEVKL